MQKVANWLDFTYEFVLMILWWLLLSWSLQYLINTVTEAIKLRSVGKRSMQWYINKKRLRRRLYNLRGK